MLKRQKLNWESAEPVMQFENFRWSEKSGDGCGRLRDPDSKGRWKTGDFKPLLYGFIFRLLSCQAFYSEWNCAWFSVGVLKVATAYIHFLYT